MGNSFGRTHPTLNNHSQINDNEPPHVPAKRPKFDESHTNIPNGTTVYFSPSIVSTIHTATILLGKPSSSREVFESYNNTSSIVQSSSGMTSSLNNNHRAPFRRSSIKTLHVYKLQCYIYIHNKILGM